MVLQNEYKRAESARRCARGSSATASSSTVRRPISSTQSTPLAFPPLIPSATASGTEEGSRGEGECSRVDGEDFEARSYARRPIQSNSDRYLEEPAELDGERSEDLELDKDEEQKGEDDDLAHFLVKQRQLIAANDSGAGNSAVDQDRDSTYDHLSGRVAKREKKKLVGAETSFLRPNVGKGPSNLNTLRPIGRGGTPPSFPDIALGAQTEALDFDELLGSLDADVLSISRSNSKLTTSTTAIGGLRRTNQPSPRVLDYILSASHDGYEPRYK